MKTPSEVLVHVNPWSVAEQLHNLYRLGSFGRYYLPNHDIFTVDETFSLERAKTAQGNCTFSKVGASFTL